jgi:hypothetical protein
MQAMTEINFPTDPTGLTPEVLTTAMSIERPGLVVEDLQVMEAFYAATGQASFRRFSRKRQAKLHWLCTPG